MSARTSTVFIALACLSAAPAAPAHDVTRASVGNGDVEPDGRSRAAAVTGDGRYVAFSTRARNLSPEDPDSRLDLYERDRENGRTRLVSRSINLLDADGDTDGPDYDESGRFLVFHSTANNLVSGDTGQTDVFLYQRDADRLLILSRAAGGGQPNGGSVNAAISGSGNAVVFESTASNLVPGDTNGTGDIFIHYPGLGETRRINLAVNGAETNGASFDADVSDDGQFVSFTSLADNLTGLGGSLSRVFVRNVIAGTTRQVGGDLSDRQISDIHDQPRLSGDGRHLAFRRVRDGGAGAQTLFLVDLQSNERTAITPPDSEAIFQVAAVSTDGTKVLFDSTSSELVPGDDNGRADVFLYDDATGTTTRVSGPSPDQGGNAESRALGLSGDGRYAVFSSVADNLVEGDDNGEEDIFLNDLREFVIDAAITGSWYDPDQDGQGFILEYLPNGDLLFYWFTFRPDGGRDWIFGILEVDGTTAEGEAFQKSGGLFPPDFDPDQVDDLAWGTVRFEFSGCDAGEVFWDSVRGGYGSGSFPLLRLTRIPGLDCR